MKLLFCTSNLPGALAIRAITWSSWSHVAILLDDGSAIEATWPKVRRVDAALIKSKHSKWQVVDVPVPDEQAAVKFAMSQIGKPYDVSALFGIMFHRNWADDSKWFCSELATAVLKAGGLKLFRECVLSRVVPQHLWMINWGSLVPM